MEKLQIKIDNLIRISLNSDFVKYLPEFRLLFTYYNPEYYKKKAIGLWAPESMKFIKTFEEDFEGTYFNIARGNINKVTDYLTNKNIPFEITDYTYLGPEVDYKLDKKCGFFNFQLNALNNLKEWKQGILIADTGSGKTRVMLRLIAEKKQRTLVIVNTYAIMESYIEEAKLVFNKKYKCGQIGDGIFDLKDITIAMIQSLYNFKEVDWDALNNYFGMIVGSEIQHLPASATYETIGKFKAHYRFGESASKTRKDGKHFLINDVIGYRVYEIPQSEIVLERRSMVPDVYFIKCQTVEYEAITDRIGTDDWFNLMELVTKDKNRNKLIVSEVKRDVEDGHTVLILVDRKEHCFALQELLLANGLRSEFMISDVNKKDRKKIMKHTQEKKVDVVVATRQLAGEGMNIPIISSLHLAVPSNNYEMSKQMSGRVRRVCKDKMNPVVKDYVDVNCSYLKNIAKKRQKFYEKLNFVMIDRI